jgi:hypothetical protein
MVEADLVDLAAEEATPFFQIRTLELKWVLTVLDIELDGPDFA